jgi:hypothetical protein
MSRKQMFKAEIREKVVQMRDGGCPVWEIVEATSLPPEDIHAVIAADDPFLLLNRKRQPVPGLDWKARLRIREMHRNGSDPLYIGNTLGFSHQIVRVVLKAWGEEANDRDYARPSPKPKPKLKRKKKASPTPPPPEPEPPRQIVYHDSTRLLIEDRKRGATLAVLAARYRMSAADVVETISRIQGHFR